MLDQSFVCDSHRGIEKGGEPLLEFPECAWPEAGPRRRLAEAGHHLLLLEARFRDCFAHRPLLARRRQKDERATESDRLAFRGESSLEGPVLFQERIELRSLRQDQDHVARKPITL